MTLGVERKPDLSKTESEIQMSLSADARFERYTEILNPFTKTTVIGRDLPIRQITQAKTTIYQAGQQLPPKDFELGKYIGGFLVDKIGIGIEATGWGIALAGATVAFISTLIVAELIVIFGAAFILQRCGSLLSQIGKRTMYYSLPTE